MNESNAKLTLALVPSSNCHCRAAILVGLGALLTHGWIASGDTLPTASDCPYVIRTWRMEDGLPENRIRSVLQTQDGHIWVGTFSGLARFDGVGFRVFDTVKTPELEDSAFRSMFEDRRGRLWLGHHNGQLTVYEYGEFHSQSLPVGWPNLEIDSFVEDKAGKMWVMNRGGWIARFQERQPEALIKPRTEHLVNHLLSDASSRLWTHRDLQVLPLRADGAVVEDDSKTVAGRSAMVVCSSRAGGIWVVDENLRRWHEGQWVEDRGPLPWSDPGLTALLETSAGDVWVGTYTKGLYVVTRDGKRHEVGVESGLSHNTVSCLWEDREHSVWVGTGGGGLNQLRRKRVRMVSPPDKWQNHPVLCVTPDLAGGLWVGTEGAGAYAYDLGEWRNYDDRHGIARRDVWSVHVDKSGGVWVGSAWNGVLKLEGNQFLPAPGWPERTWIVYALLAGRQGDLWAGGERGVGWFHGGSWQVMDLDPAVEEERVRQIAQDVTGTTWFATAGHGLWSLREGQRQRYGRADGFESEYLTSLYIDTHQTLWIGTKGGGLWRHRDGRFVAITSAQGLPASTVVSIVGDRKGHLWLSTPQGLIRVSLDQLNECADGQLQSVDCLQLDLSDGLKGLEFEGPNQPNSCCTPDGRLWFATSAGLAVVDPLDLYTNQLAPQILINSLVVDGQNTPFDAALIQRAAKDETGPAWQQRLVIPPGRHRFELHYAGLSFAAPDRMRFRHRLEGLEKQWNEAGNTRIAPYSYLPPGDYTFHVTACNNDGVWNETGARLAFRLLPHFWQTWWFRAGSLSGASLLLTAGAVTILRRRHRRKLEVIERQRAVERERMRIAQDIHDDLGANLTRISLLSQSALGRLEGADAAASDVTRIHQTAHDLTRALDEIVWAVNPRHDTLNSLVNYLTNYVEETIEPAGVRLSLEMPVSLPAWPLKVEVRHNLFLAAKEALNNVLKHAQASELRVTLKLVADGFTLELADNGRGFAVATEGDGLGNMHHRMSDIGGACQITSAPNQGTRVRFTVPVETVKPNRLTKTDALSPK